MASGWCIYFAHQPCCKLQCFYLFLVPSCREHGLKCRQIGTPKGKGHYADRNIQYCRNLGATKPSAIKHNSTRKLPFYHGFYSLHRDFLSFLHITPLTQIFNLATYHWPLISYALFHYFETCITNCQWGAGFNSSWHRAQTSSRAYPVVCRLCTQCFHSLAKLNSMWKWYVTSICAEA